MSSQQILPLLALLSFAIVVGIAAFAQHKSDYSGPDTPAKGLRPYELDWAGRFEDDHEPLVDFEEMKGWSVEASGGSAQIGRSQEQMIWGSYTCKIAYRGNAGGASFVLRPPVAIPIPHGFDAANLWVWNDYWMWEGDRGKPMAKISLLLESAEGKSHEVPFPRDLDWPGWYLLHIRLTAEQRKAFAKGGVLKGIKLSNCLLDEEKCIFLDNLSFFREELKPLKFDVLPRPGVDLAPGQDLGVNTGEQRLAFPTREQTLLPENLTKEFRTELTRDGEAFVFRYVGEDGVLEYRYKPVHGDLGDITAQWMDGRSPAVTPMDKGGIQLKKDDEVEGLLHERFGNFMPDQPITAAPDRRELIECKIDGNTVVARWKVSCGSQSANVEYVFRLWQKSLVTDVHCLGGQVGAVSLGKVSGATAPRLIEVPHWVGRPRVLLMGPAENPLFLSSFVDHYRTGASQLYFKNVMEEGEAYCGGGTRYLPKTDGKRNDCHERLFLTLSRRFEETLPEIPNPPSRWRSEAARYLVCYFAVQDRQTDYARWKRIARYGMNKVIILDWETCWRDAAESFTFRTAAAPGKGGDENLREFIRKIQQLGFRYALYNNYVDYAPVNALWDEDMVSRLPNGNWQQSWFRTYLPKPSRVVKLSRILTSVMQGKFEPLAAGPDVQTAVNPWSRVDYDHRVPGAAAMMSQYYAYAQLLLEQQEIWNGPVYSEGGNNYYYSGLATGSAAIDHEYDLGSSPWLVDFYLRKMQPLGCNWGICRGQTDQELDRALARTIAFALPAGFLAGWRREMDHLTVRGYYMLQQLQASYCEALIKDIRYADEQGRLLETSQAIATGAHSRCQIRLEYDNGLVVWINGHKDDNWKTPQVLLPPAGYYAANPDGSLKVFSALCNGRRADYVHSPAYDYVDGRGQWLETPWAAGDGQLIVLKNEDGSREVIPYGAKRFAISLENKPKAATALDMEGDEIGSAQWEVRGGMYHIVPVDGAASYLLRF